ncbi:MULTISPECIES: 3'-5' exonuclease [unclassified Aureimonas]|uniref:3'-5' exonuclease n=1 Tax=unclassified Aureimonas TaxID=2615206 RepID=UPI0006F6CD71|nr:MULTISPECIES: 3'-5' exonuclease [unclassified Aureimonas]KQT52847.1 hypothetical protein ASG62_13065 [Aureimonas sp. Leaf427]KQT80306.1 hypothetical protein ASG54_06915 [Aureimonas sp. Leaf460]
MTIVAIDFETANASRASACAIGLAFVEGGSVTRRAYHLLRPPEMRFDAGNIRVHGIRPEDVRDAPEFPDIYETFRHEIDGALILAHNASFDLAVLGQTLALYGLPRPALASLCTVQLGRRLWPEAPDHKLSTLARRFGVTFRHHHAGEDAFACAAIAIEGVRKAEVRDIEHLARFTSLRRAHAADEAAPAARPGGIAARALEQRRPRPAAPSGRFVVRGSTGTPYDVQLVSKGGVPALRCSCTAGRFGNLCRHVKGLMAGDRAQILSGDEAQLREVVALFSKVGAR